MRAQAKRSFATQRDGSAGRPAGRSFRFAIGLLAVALLVLAPSAVASITSRAQTGSLGADGTPFSTFDQPGKLAFDQASNRLYVLERTGEEPGVQGEIHAFDTPSLGLSGGNFPLSVTAPELGNTNGIRADNTAGPSAGRLYYLDRNSNVLEGFDSTGTLLGPPFPISPPAPKNLSDVAVDSAGNILIANNSELAKQVLRYASDGTPLEPVDVSAQGNGRPGNIAVDSNDNIFVAVTSGELYRYDAPAYTTATPITLPPPPGQPTALWVDISSDTLYVAVDRFDGDRVVAFDAASGAFLYEFALDIPGADLGGLAVDQETDQLYLSDRGNHKVHVFGPAQVFADATATPVAAKEITDSSALIGATISDNNVLPTNWRLETSDDSGSTWDPVDSGTTANKGASVAATGPSVGTLTVKAGGGTFKLGFESEATSAISYDASAATVQAALEDLSAIEPGDVEVSGGPGSATGSTPYTIIFTGALAGTSVAEIGIDPLNLVGAPENVSATVSDLDPNTGYRFRIVTNKGTEASTAVPSSSLFFKTVAPPPVIADVGAIQINDTSARLVATIDPRNTATGYVFEYGPTPALGSSTAPLNIGGGTAPLTVSQVVGGLSKDTTYYFRVVATNLSGTTASPSVTFTTRATPLPNPAGRAYEQVTPVDKNYGDSDVATLVGTRVGAAANGEGVVFCTMSQFGEPPGRMAGVCSPYVSRRTATGWNLLNDRFPEFCRIDPVSGDANGALVALPSPDYSRLLFSKSEYEGCAVPPLDPAAPLESHGASFNLYLQGPLSEPAAYDLLNPASEGSGTVGPEFAGGSDDFSHVVYHSRSNQTPDSPPPGNFRKVYEWADGALRLVSKDANDNPFESGSAIPRIGEVGGYPALNLASAVSADGERIYFANPTDPDLSTCLEAGCELYLREGGATTHDVSASECTEECGTPQSKADFFLSATPAGDKVFFTSCAKLTDISSPEGCATSASWEERFGGEAGSKLYRWQLDAPLGSRLVDLTADHEPADGTQPGFYGLIGQSEDGDTAYFVTRGQIVAGEPTFPTGVVGNIRHALSGGKLYRWRWNDGSPSTDYIGPYEGLLPGKLITIDYNIAQQRRQVSADGKYITIYTAAAVDRAADHDSDVDVYRWGEEEGWICASCQLPGAPSGGDVDLAEMLPRSAGDFEAVVGVEPGIQMSADGQRVFFGTPDALVPEDVNGEVACPLESALMPTLRVRLYACNDIYEWHDGAVNLVSSGTADESARLIGASASGRDVFFFSRDRLVGWDVDNNVDIYDARIGGGFPEPPAQPPTCEGEGCRGAGSAAPAIVGAGTGAFQGPGNPKAQPPQGCPKGKRQVRRKGKARCVAKGNKRQHKRANSNRRAGR